MRRREFLALAGSTALARPLTLHAQQHEKMRRIGVLMALAENDLEAKAQIAAFRKGLSDHGWAEGRNVSLELRFADAMPEHLPALARELVLKNVDIVVTHGTPGVQAAQKASPIVAIVFATIGDPVATGIVTSLARPGGNITGLSLIATDLSIKRLELLKETLPHLTRVAMLSNPANASLVLQVKETEAAARMSRPSRLGRQSPAHLNGITGTRACGAAR